MRSEECIGKPLARMEPPTYLLSPTLRGITAQSSIRASKLVHGDVALDTLQRTGLLSYLRPLEIGRALGAANV